MQDGAAGRINSIQYFQVSYRKLLSKMAQSRSKKNHQKNVLKRWRIQKSSPKYLSKSEAEIYYRIDRQTLEAEKFEESNIELFVEAAYEDADETADEVIIEKTVIESIIETVLEEADKVIEIEETSVELAVLEAAERVDEFIVDPSIEAISGRGTIRRRGRRRS